MTTQTTSRESEADDLYGAKGLFGAGFLENHIRNDFRDLCRLIGKENAHREVSEIINAEFERKAR